ncbi:MAG: zinc dependent phospholipase C family protein [Deltaproteobacteria bacterium]|jgi:hypothetical protein|nr:zinc dependent phospholipase C family protein [Deltaproteobacteria bacterium]
MPKEISHWTFAEKAFQNLSEQSEIKICIQKHQQLYLIGAIAPDFPCGILFGPNKNRFRQLMTQLHDTPVSISSFKPVLKALSSYQGQVPDFALSFFAGVIAHMNADITFHPLVYYYSGNDPGQKDTETRHSILETTLDLHLLYDVSLGNQESLAYSLHHKSVSEAQLLELLTLYYGLDFHRDRSQIKRLLKYYSFLQWGFKQKRIYQILRKFEGLTGIYQKHNYSYFYPEFKKTVSDFWGKAISYQHPVTGKLNTTSLKELEKDFLDKTASDFDTINSINQRQKSDIISLFPDQPNLLTGMIEATQKDMTFFDLNGPLQGVLDY